MTYILFRFKLKELIDISVSSKFSGFFLDFPNSTEESYRDAKMKENLSIGTAEIVPSIAVIIYNLAFMTPAWVKSFQRLLNVIYIEHC